MSPIGLDQYLYARRYVSGYTFVKQAQQSAYAQLRVIDPVLDAIADEDTPSGEIVITVAYWRKANHIHKWFVDNCQGGIDECQFSTVYREQLIELLGICRQVILDKDRAEDHLPSQGGFFFGSTDYDEYYLQDVMHTVERLTAILDATAERPYDYEFQYRSSW